MYEQCRVAFFGHSKVQRNRLVTPKPPCHDALSAASAVLHLSGILSLYFTCEPNIFLRFMCKSHEIFAAHAHICIYFLEGASTI